MKKALKKLIIKILKSRTDRALSNNKTKIIGVTGTVGKTTTKNVIAQILRQKFNVLESAGGFNTQIGMMLSILGEKSSGFTSVFKWIGILRRTSKEIKLPEMLILEYGVDKKGDMDKLLDIAKPDIAVITKIAPGHLGEGQFENMDEIAQEKLKLAKSAKEMVILNADCDYLSKAKIMNVKTVTFGTQNATYLVHDLQDKASGFSFMTRKKVFQVPIYGAFQYPSFLPGIILGLEYGIPIIKIANVISEFRPLPGRGNIFRTVNGSRVWDSSYNASPESVTKSLEIFKKIPAKKHLALLGNMNELGKNSEKYHEQIGQKAAEVCDEIFFVGKEHIAFEKGVNNKKPLKFFKDALEAGKYLKNYLTKNDLLLVKGSQNNVRLERAVEILLVNERDKEKLCRRGKGWAN